MTAIYRVLGVNPPRGLELLWASALGTRTELASSLLLDLDTLAGLLPLHTMHQTWSYACHVLIRVVGAAGPLLYIVVGTSAGIEGVARVTVAVEMLLH